METASEYLEKVKIYINVEPFGLKFGAIFKKSETFQSPLNFVLNQIKKLGIKFEIGRIIEDKTGAILLNEFLIGDFLEKNDQITIFSEEYGLINKNLPGDNPHNSSKKNFFMKNASNLYKSKNFLKNKRKEKEKEKQKKKIQKKIESKEESNDENVSNKEIEKIQTNDNINNTNKKEKIENKNEKSNKKKNKTDKKRKLSSQSEEKNENDN